jgi:hypothetical protein
MNFMTTAKTFVEALAMLCSPYSFGLASGIRS